MKRATVIAVLFLSNYLYASYQDIERIESEDFRNIIGVLAARESRSDLHLLAKESNLLVYNIHHTSTVDLLNQSLRDVYILRQESGKIKWKRVKQAPMPDIIYDYSFLKNKKRSVRKQAQLLKRRLRRQGIPFVNHPSLVTKVSSKRSFAAAMHQEGLNHPETKDFSPKNLAYLLNKFGRVFIKPNYGSGGKGIMIVEKGVTSYKLTVNLPKEAELFKDGIYEPISDVSTYMRVRFEDLDTIEMFDLIQTIIDLYFDQYHHDYTVQQGISGICLRGKSFDLRVTTQRDGSNEIKVTGAFLRVGGNISQGGYFAPISLISELVGEDAENLLQSAFQLALAAHSSLEEPSHGKTFAELGCDIVFDQEGKAFIIETNAKPGYINIFDQHERQLFGADHATIVKQLRAMDDTRNRTLLDYSLYLKAS